jgi:hypothetical protein
MNNNKKRIHDGDIVYWISKGHKCGYVPDGRDKTFMTPCRFIVMFAARKYVTIRSEEMNKEGFSFRDVKVLFEDLERVEEEKQ